MIDSGAVRTILAEMAAVMEAGDRAWRRDAVRDALSGSDAALEAFLVSNDLWGGAGSIADEACIEDTAQRAALEGLLMQLGKLQIEAGMTNVRTAMWVTAFQKSRA